MRSSSILHQVASQLGIDLNTASAQERVELYRHTLVNIEESLDITDLRKVTKKILESLCIDLAEIIRGFRDLRNGLDLLPLQSINGILNHLRKARDRLSVASDLIEETTLDIVDRRYAFYKALSRSRACLERALSFFRHP